MLTRRAFLLGMGVTIGRPPVSVDEIGDQVQTVPRGQLPDFAGPAPHVRVAYRYAAERGPDLEAVQCYCGCSRFGHRHNRDCYVKAVHPDGSVTFTSHAAT